MSAAQQMGAARAGTRPMAAKTIHTDTVCGYDGRGAGWNIISAVGGAGVPWAGVTELKRMTSGHGRSCVWGERGCGAHGVGEDEGARVGVEVHEQAAECARVLEKLFLRLGDKHAAGRSGRGRSARRIVGRRQR